MIAPRHALFLSSSVDRLLCTQFICVLSSFCSMLYCHVSMSPGDSVHVQLVGGSGRLSESGSGQTGAVAERPRTCGQLPPESENGPFPSLLLL